MTSTDGADAKVLWEKYGDDDEHGNAWTPPLNLRTLEELSQ